MVEYLLRQVGLRTLIELPGRTQECPVLLSIRLLARDLNGDGVARVSQLLVAQGLAKDRRIVLALPSSTRDGPLEKSTRSARHLGKGSLVSRERI